MKIALPQILTLLTTNPTERKKQPPPLPKIPYTFKTLFVYQIFNNSFQKFTLFIIYTDMYFIFLYLIFNRFICLLLFLALAGGVRALWVSEHPLGKRDINN